MCSVESDEYANLRQQTVKELSHLFRRNSGNIIEYKVVEGNNMVSPDKEIFHEVKKRNGNELSDTSCCSDKQESCKHVTKANENDRDASFPYEKLDEIKNSSSELVEPMMDETSNDCYENEACLYEYENVENIDNSVTGETMSSEDVIEEALKENLDGSLSEKDTLHKTINSTELLEQSLDNTHDNNISSLNNEKSTDIIKQTNVSDTCTEGNVEDKYPTKESSQSKYHELTEDIIKTSETFDKQIKSLDEYINNIKEGVYVPGDKCNIQDYIERIKQSHLNMVRKTLLIQNKIDAQNHTIIRLQQDIITANNERMKTDSYLHEKLEEKEKIIMELQKEFVKVKDKKIKSLTHDGTNGMKGFANNATSTNSSKNSDECGTKQENYQQNAWKSGLPIHRKPNASSPKSSPYKKIPDEKISIDEKLPPNNSFPLLMNPCYPMQKLEGDLFKETIKKINTVLNTIGHKLNIDSMNATKSGGVIIFFQSYQHRNIAKAALENAVLQLKMKPIIICPRELTNSYKNENLHTKPADTPASLVSPARFGILNYPGKK